MKTTIEFEGTIIELSAKLVKSGIPFPNGPMDKTLHNQFRVNISTSEGNASFLFHGSFHDYKKGKTELSKEDLKEALYCFVTDAMSANECFTDFCGEFGYKEHTKQASNIYNACVKHLEKYEKILPNTDIYDLAEYLQD